MVWARISFSLAHLPTVVAGGSYYCFHHTPAINCCTYSKLSSFEEMIAKVSVWDFSWLLEGPFCLSHFLDFWFFSGTPAYLQFSFWAIILPIPSQLIVFAFKSNISSQMFLCVVANVVFFSKRFVSVILTACMCVCLCMCMYMCRGMCMCLQVPAEPDEIVGIYFAHTRVPADRVSDLGQFSGS